MSWTMGQDDGAGLVRYANSSANLRVFLAHGLSLHCSRACVAETRSAHPRSLLQDRHAWSHLLRAVPVLLSHHWPSTCSRVVYCPAHAHACGIEPSRPLAKHFRSHSRMRRFNSARTSGSCNSAASLKLRVEPASCYSCPDLRMGGGSSSCLAAPHLLRARHARPPPLLRRLSFRLAAP
jgi:hypothetical protein